MPIVGQDDKYFLTDKGGRVAKAGLSDEKRLGYEQQLVASNFGELAKQPGALPEEASPFPAGAPNMTPVPMQSTIQAPQGGSIWDQAAAYTASSPTQLNLAPQQQANLGGVVDLSGVNPQPQPMGFDPSIKKGLIQGYEMQQAGVRKQANAIEKMNIEALKEQQALERDMAMTNYDIMRTQEKRDEAAGLAMQKLEQAKQDYANAKIDPDRFFGNDTGKRILAGIAIAFGAMGSALSGSKQNTALSIINKAIENDIAAQEKNRDALGKRIDFERLGLQDIKSRYDDSVKGKLAQKAMSIEMAQMKIDQIGKRYGTEEAQAKAQSLIGQLEVEKQNARSKLAQLEADAVTAQPQQSLQSAVGMTKDERERFVPGWGIALTKEDAKDLKQASQERKKFTAQIDEMIELRKKHGGGATFNRTDVQRGKQLSKDLLLSYKNMAKLGVLSKSDEDIINAIIPDDPLSYRDPVSAMRGEDPVLSRLEKFKQDTENYFSEGLQLRLERPTEQAVETYRKGSSNVAEDQRRFLMGNRNAVGGR